MSRDKGQIQGVGDHQARPDQICGSLRALGGASLGGLPGHVLVSDSIRVKAAAQEGGCARHVLFTFCSAPHLHGKYSRARNVLVHIMEVKSEPLARIDCQQGFLRAVRFNADGQYALSCGSDRTIKLWRPSKLLQLKCYKGHSADVIDCQANHDSSQFVSCSQDRSLIVWDVENGKMLRRFRNLAPFNTVCYGGHQSSTALAGSIDGALRIYDLRALNAWEPIQTLSEAGDSVTCCRAQDHLVLSTSLDKGLRIYDLRKGSLEVDTMHMALNYVTLSRDTKSVLVTCLRGSSYLLDRQEAMILNEYKGNQNKLFKLESSLLLADSCVASGSEDGRAYVWDLVSEQPRLALEHQNLGAAAVQSVSSDSLDFLLTCCRNYMFMWSI